MKAFAIILLVFGSTMVFIDIVPMLLTLSIHAGLVGRAVGWAIVFILPGILLYRKSSKKTTDSKGGQNKGDIDATKTEEPTKEKKGGEGKENRKA
jgi:hypothetical protein